MDHVAISSTVWMSWHLEQPMEQGKEAPLFPTGHRLFVQIPPSHLLQPVTLLPPLLPFASCPFSCQKGCLLPLVLELLRGLLEILIWTVLSHREWAVQAVWVPALSQTWKMEMIHYRDSQYSADCLIKTLLPQPISASIFCVFWRKLTLVNQSQKSPSKFSTTWKINVETGYVANPSKQFFLYICTHFCNLALLQHFYMTTAKKGITRSSPLSTNPKLTIKLWTITDLYDIHAAGVDQI